MSSNVYAGNTVILDANKSPPYWSASLPNDGMCGEIVHAASRAAGLVSEIKYKPLKRMIEDDTNNDLGNPEFYMRNQNFTAIVPIGVYHVSIFAYKPHFSKPFTFQSIEDLRGLKVGVLKGTVVARTFLEQAGVLFEESYSHTSMFKKLRKGRIDLAVEVDLVGRRTIAKLYGSEKENFSIHLLNKSESPIAILLSETQADGHNLGEHFRKGMQKIKASGEYDAILQRYYPAGNMPKNYYRQLKRFEMLYGYNGLE